MPDKIIVGNTQGHPEYFVKCPRVLSDDASSVRNCVGCKYFLGSSMYGSDRVVGYLKTKADYIHCEYNEKGE